MPWSALDVFRLLTVALADEEPWGVVPAAYLFGHTPDNEDSLLVRGAELFDQRKIRQILLCGGGPYRTPRSPEAPIAYSGEDAWRKILVEEGVPEENIFGIPRPLLSHTGTEAERLVLWARERRWLDLFIVALPMHMPRAFANAITQTLRLYPALRIWCKPGATLPYAENAVSSQGTVQGVRLFEGVSAEYDRLNATWDNPLDIAPPDAIMEYILRRRG